MKIACVLLLAALLVEVGSAASPTPADRPALVRPAADETYTIISTLELARPFNVADMTDDFQEARLISETKASCQVEITYYPLFAPAIGENKNWRTDYAGMSAYLAPTPTENWDEEMRQHLLRELAAASIRPDQLSDREVVEQVSRWAMKRTHSAPAFAIWMVHFPEGAPRVFPPLQAAFERERRDPSWSDEYMFGQELLGRSMYYNKVRGACTSSSIYLTTLLRALGIPTRIVLCVPPFDANDARQAAMFYAAIHHHRVRETVRAALGAGGGNTFSDHFFNEVYVGNRWTRLNYTRLGQPILDEQYFGLLTHILTTADLSQVPLAETWGVRMHQHENANPRLSSVNPYRLLAVHDRFGEHAHVDNPPQSPPPELTVATISALLPVNSPDLPGFVADGIKDMSRRPDFFLSYPEWVKGRGNQMREFWGKVGHDFVLSAEGQPDLRARLHSLRISQGNGRFQAFAVEITADDREKITPGVAYTLRPINTSETYRWAVAPDLSPIVLK